MILYLPSDPIFTPHAPKDAPHSSFCNKKDRPHVKPIFFERFFEKEDEIRRRAILRVAAH